jgi:hypothetical protein
VLIGPTILIISVPVEHQVFRISVLVRHSSNTHKAYYTYNKCSIYYTYNKCSSMLIVHNTCSLSGFWLAIARALIRPTIPCTLTRPTSVCVCVCVCDRSGDREKEPVSTCARPFAQGKSSTCVSKEPYSDVKKKTYVCVKRDLHMRECQKRPAHVSKETYSCVKRVLLMRQKRPI